MEDKENTGEDLKMNPYDRLQSIFSEKNAGKLTEASDEKLDYLLGNKPKTSIFDGIFGIFKRIDSWVFAERSRTNNGMFSRRKKEKGRWT